MSSLIFIYLIFPAIMLVLFFLSKDYELPPGISDTGISRAFLKISLYIYKKLYRFLGAFNREQIRGYLGTMENLQDPESRETEYFIRKISIVLLMACAGSFLSLMLSISSLSAGNITPQGTVKRNSFGEREYDLDLVARDDAGNELGEYDLNVKTRQYTTNEAEVLFKEASEVMERTILKENKSLEEVRSDLDLCEKLTGYPFDIRWRVDNYEVMHFDGRLIEENIPKQGVSVTLTATYSYGEKRWQQVFGAFILPKVLTPQQRIFEEIGRLLKDADETSREDAEIELPDSLDGRKVNWSEKTSDNSLLLLILTLIGGAASYVYKDKELKKSMEKRQQELLADYPQLVTKLVLYMGAGMTVRNIFAMISATYLKDLEKGGKKKYLFEEIVRSHRELMAGASEAEVYERLGFRCGIRQYTRLTTLLSQNLKKGNSELLKLLSEESEKAFDERMDRVRKSGEEAGTRLLLPMIIMLVIVMVMIIIPAYMAF